MLPLKCFKKSNYSSIQSTLATISQYITYSYQWLASMSSTLRYQCPCPLSVAMLPPMLTTHQESNMVYDHNYHHYHRRHSQMGSLLLEATLSRPVDHTPPFQTAMFSKSLIVSLVVRVCQKCYH